MSPDSSTPIADSLRRSLRLLLIATCGLWLVTLGGGGYLVWKVSTTADRASATAAATRVAAAVNGRNQATTHAALCTFRDDLGKRIAQTGDYLKEHPGPLILGAPRATFEKSLADEVRTYGTLSGLGC